MKLEKHNHYQFRICEQTKSRTYFIDEDGEKFSAPAFQQNVDEVVWMYISDVNDDKYTFKWSVKNENFEEGKTYPFVITSSVSQGAKNISFLVRHGANFSTALAVKRDDTSEYAFEKNKLIHCKVEKIDIENNGIALQYDEHFDEVSDALKLIEEQKALDYIAEFKNELLYVAKIPRKNYKLGVFVALVQHIKLPLDDLISTIYILYTRNDLDKYTVDMLLKGLYAYTNYSAESVLQMHQQIETAYVSEMALDHGAINEIVRALAVQILLLKHNGEYPRFKYVAFYRFMAYLATTDIQRDVLINISLAYAHATKVNDKSLETYLDWKDVVFKLEYDNILEKIKLSPTTIKSPKTYVPKKAFDSKKEKILKSYKALVSEVVKTLEYKALFEKRLPKRIKLLNELRRLCRAIDSSWLLIYGLQQSYFLALISFCEQDEKTTFNGWKANDKALKRFPHLRCYYDIISLLTNSGVQEVNMQLLERETSEADAHLRKLIRLIVAYNLQSSVSDNSDWTKNSRNMIIEFLLGEEEYKSITKGTLDALEVDAEEEEPLNLGLEDGQREFKKSILFPPGSKEPNIGRQAAVIMRTIAGFLNGRGGSLFLGVDDKGNIVGLSSDFKALGKDCGPDRYERELRRYIVDGFGKDINSSIDLKFQTVANMTYCEVIIPESKSPVCYKNDFWQRQGNETRILKGNDIALFIKRKLD